MEKLSEESANIENEIGPIPPPETVNGLKVDEKDKSALKDSIKKKG